MMPFLGEWQGRKNVAILDRKKNGKGKTKHPKTIPLATVIVNFINIIYRERILKRRFLCPVIKQNVFLYFLKMC